MADMLPEGFIKRVEPLRLVLFAKRVHLLQQIRMRADRTLTEHDQIARQDVGGGIYASKIAKSRAVTVAIDAMNFRKPVYIGDVVSVHANTVRLGKTSITVHIEAWVMRRDETHSILVTDGNFTYVAIDDQGRPRAIAAK